MKKILFALSAVLTILLAACNSEKSSDGGGSGSSSFNGNPQDYNGDYTVTSVEFSCGGEEFDKLSAEEKETTLSYALSNVKELYEGSTIYMEFDSVGGICQFRDFGGEIKQTSPGVYEAGDEGNGVKATLGESNGKKIITFVLTRSDETYNETITLTATKDKEESSNPENSGNEDSPTEMSGYEGSYVFTKVNAKGGQFERMSSSDLRSKINSLNNEYNGTVFNVSSYNDVVVLEINNNGSSEYTTFTKNENGIYEAYDDGIKINLDFSELMGNSYLIVTMENDGEIILYAEKRDDDMQTEVVAVAEEPAEGYYEDWDDDYYDSPEGGQLYPGEYLGKIDGKTEIVMEVTSAENGKIFGNMYYPNSVKRYGKTSQTLMPFSGEQDWDGNITLIVKSPTDATYGEDWTLHRTGQYVGGIIHTSKGENWSVAFDLTDTVTYY